MRRINKDVFFNFPTQRLRKEVAADFRLSSMLREFRERRRTKVYIVFIIL